MVEPRVSAGGRCLRSGDVGKHTVAFDTTGSGVADHREFYDGKGELRRAARDRDGGGKFEQTHFYGPGKQLMRLEQDTNSDRNADQWQFFAQGKVAKMALDQDHKR